ncbi:hypothetical protein AB4Z18_05585 [Leifsonia sp. 2TAF2]|uniref:hypothetical protein n=1 Tax=Leifsonia sp. 2TAF2 TaxID=3233009 RepID=UPI003F95246E
MKRHPFRLALSAVAVAAVCVTLSGCAGAGADRSVRYSGEVDGGTIAEVRYDFVDGPNGAISLPANPGGPTWSKKLDGGHGPRLVVMPSADGVARCELTAVGSKKVLDSAVGQPGKPVVCHAEIATD